MVMCIYQEKKLCKFSCGISLSYSTCDPVPSILGLWKEIKVQWREEVLSCNLLLEAGWLTQVGYCINMYTHRQGKAFTLEKRKKEIKRKAICSCEQCCGSGSAWNHIKLKGRIRIRIRIRIKVICWIRIGLYISLQMTSQMYGIWDYLSTFSRFWAFI